jgi:hypothetical protein
MALQQSKRFGWHLIGMSAFKGDDGSISQSMENVLKLIEVNLRANGLRVFKLSQAD